MLENGRMRGPGRTSAYRCFSALVIAAVLAAASGCASSPPKTGRERIAPVRVAIIDSAVPDTTVYDCFRLSTEAGPERRTSTHGQMVLAVALGLGSESEPGSDCPEWSGSVDLVVHPVGEDGAPSGREVADAITSAASRGADIINVSIALTEPSAPLEAAVGDAESAGSLLVAASGNTSGSPALFPAAYDSVLSVGSCSFDGARSDFSAVRGVDLCAVGESVPVVLSDGSKEHFSGTSAAAATITHQAILLASASEVDLTPAQLASRLRDSNSLPTP